MMFLGHYAIAFAAKKAAPKTSLGSLILAAQFLDLLWPVFLLLGIEHVRIDPGNTVVTPLDFLDYPVSHSLLGALGWSVLLGGLFFLLWKKRQAAWVIAACVFSHWILDVIVHRPDLPLGFGAGTYAGLGIWNSLAGTLIVELGLFLGGVVLYLRTTQPKDRTGVFSFWGLALFLLVIYFMNLFGPPPPGEMEIAIAANAAWLMVFWGYWIDRHRRLATEHPVSSPSPDTSA
jgi:hypothetical protein